MRDLDLLEISGKISYEKVKIDDSFPINGTIYKVINVHKDTNKKGLQAVTLINTETKEYVIGFQGTDFKDFNDVSADASLLSNSIHPQFEEAVNYYKEMDEKFKKVSYVCGNSLGGGLANYVAVKNQKVNSVTYNPAILPKSVNVSDTKNIKNYIGSYDPLTLVELAAGFKSGIPGEIITTRTNSCTCISSIKSYWLCRIQQ